jgi:tetratricopeptide (TPR) repeat protein
VGIDLLAIQYAAYRAYAAIQAILGNKRTALRSLENAAKMKTLINTTWWNAAGGYFYAFFNKQHQFTGRAGADLLYRDAAEVGPKTASALRTLLATMKTEPRSAVEAKSHYAEILYRYGNAAEARAQILDLTGESRERREYPEVSYSVIGAMTTGLMGVRVEPTQPLSKISADRHLAVVVETLPRLTPATGWAELRNLPVQGSMISVRHDSEHSTKLMNKGTKALVWRAAFRGSFATLLVGGKPLNAHAGSADRGFASSSVEVAVSAGDTVAVKVPS